MFLWVKRPYLLFILSLIGSGKTIQHTDSNRGNDLRLVVVSNGVAILPCGNDEQHKWEWSRENVILKNDGRIKITEEGHLLIKDAIEEDSGVYVCKATRDGQLSKVNVTLIVLVSDSPPYFYNFTHPSNTIRERNGSTVLLQCPARGHPTPRIKWVKDGVQMNISLPEKATEYLKWSLTLKNVQSQDSGNYTCCIANEFGSVNATFHLQVVPQHSIQNFSRPDLAVFHSLNTTVKYGSSATFQCRVRSEAPPNIQWLKKIDDSELPKWQREHREVIKVQGENYRVLQSSEVVERSDGSFLNKLTIPEVFEGDSGKYICLGANSMGYSFRSAYLTVLPRPRALPLGWSRSVAIHPGNPNSLLVAIPVTLGIVVGVMVALVVMCHKRRMDSHVPLPAAGYRKEDPRKTKAESGDEPAYGQYSADEAEDFKEENAYLSRLQSEVELEGSGNVVTKICAEQNPSSTYESCFVMRNEV